MSALESYMVVSLPTVLCAFCFGSAHSKVNYYVVNDSALERYRFQNFIALRLEECGAVAQILQRVHLEIL